MQYFDLWIDVLHAKVKMMIIFVKEKGSTVKPQDMRPHNAQTT